MRTRSRLTLTVLAGLLLGICLSYTQRVLADHARKAPSSATTATTASTASTATASARANALPLQDAQLFAQVMQRIRQEYVDPVSDHQLMQAAIRGMVESLDAHSTFLSDDQFQDMKVTTSGTYAGIGVEVSASKDGVSVVRRMPGSPAARAGLRAGDIIVRIDNVAVDSADVDAAIERMRGPTGSPIRLAVRREGTPALLRFDIRRAPVKLVSVESELLTRQYGYVRITSFTDSTADELESAVDALEHAPAATKPLKGFVIDLRNNPGGVLDAAVQVADDFLDQGTIVSAKGRTVDANFRVTARPGDITGGAKLVLLVNGGSASAAEILAAALHDNKRAVLVGRRTYGKGTVQTIMPLSNGTALKLTTSRYYTPAGISINGVGIVPDVVLTGPEQLPADLDDGDGNAKTPAPTLAQRDLQVGMALDMLGAYPSRVAGTVVGAARGASAVAR
ncbi:MAG TPA: S41 family peptidase [Steroidobacteraceae bacterium]|jgi:carboxyl-terminal processing protease|nr:S41 family peptidase [Steroidobacteraceae bacterium]